MNKYNAMLIFGVVMCVGARVYAADGNVDPITNSELYKKVWLEPKNYLDPSISPKICANAQEEYKYAKFTAHVRPHNEVATVEVQSGSVTIVSSTSVKDGDDVTVKLKENFNVGKYAILIKLDDARGYGEGLIFKFLYSRDVVNKKEETVGSGNVNMALNLVSATTHYGDVFNNPNGAYLDIQNNIYIITSPAGAYDGKVKSAFKVKVDTNPTYMRVERMTASTDNAGMIELSYKIIKAKFPESCCAAALIGEIQIENEEKVLSQMLNVNNKQLALIVPDHVETTMPIHMTASSNVYTFHVGRKATTLNMSVKLTATSKSDDVDLFVPACLAAERNITSVSESNTPGYQIVR
mgnify:CR=1 FL=1